MCTCLFAWFRKYSNESSFLYCFTFEYFFLYQRLMKCTEKLQLTKMGCLTTWNLPGFWNMEQRIKMINELSYKNSVEIFFKNKCMLQPLLAFLLATFWRSCSFKAFHLKKLFLMYILYFYIENPSLLLNVLFSIEKKFIFYFFITLITFVTLMFCKSIIIPFSLRFCQIWDYCRIQVHQTVIQEIIIINFNVILVNNWY